MSSSFRASSILRLVNSRLRDLPPSALPLVIPQLARSLVDCKTILSAPASSPKESADALQLHTFKTQVTTYLNSRAPEEKWAAVILIKAVVELGGLEVLQICKQWVNGLLSILGKADSPSTKKLCIVLLTRIFLLTHGHQTIVREITTPSLPTFIDACLKLVVPKGASAAAPSDSRTRTQATLLQPILECLSNLVPNHPTIFRTFASQLQHLIAPLLAPTPSSSTGTDAEENLKSQPIATAIANTLTANTAITPAAHALFVALHFTRATAKSPADSEYTQQLNAILGVIHSTAAVVFRAVMEDWTSTTGSSLTVQSDTYSSTVSSCHITPPYPLNLPGWTGIHAGCERLSGLLSLLRTYLQSRSGSSPVSMPIGALVDALVRISLVTVPRSSSVGQGQRDTIMADFTDTSIRANEQIGREEREALFAHLPQIHAAMFGVMDVLLRSIGLAHTSWMRILLQQAVWVIKAESFDAGVREGGYDVVKSCINLHGRTLDTDMVNTISPVLKRACEETVNTSQSVEAQQNGRKTASGTQSGKKGAAPATTLNSDNMFASATNTAPILFQQTPQSAERTCAQNKAFALITTFLLKVPTTSDRKNLRSQLDNAIILSNDRDAMLASVLNPPRSKASEKTHSSILPLVARAHNGSAELEGYIRPRMPIVITDYDNDDDEVDDDDQMEADDEMRDDDAQNDEQNGDSEQKTQDMKAAIVPPETSSILQEPSDQEVEKPAPATLPVSAMPTEAQPLAQETSVASAQPTLKRPTPPDDTEPAFAQQSKKARQSPTPLSQTSVAPATAAPARLPVPVAGTSSAAAVANPAVVDDDDDDNFVIPALTMEPDSDEEMEEEGEGDG